ncbi:MAG: hypothetical protein PHR77_09970 [Kiritimatiellae bacterium]|nr:hypothetical protein [Kiritimatiellia bacterium]MDD5519675.1 hypothetical protein [Kiritimatiellia bacterium]
MHIEKHLDVINACRFCFMCRHLDPVGNVTFMEADTPRGRALIIDRIHMDHECLKNQDFISTMYRSALSAANRYHCVSHYDETALVLAVRRDIVEAGLVPEKVKALAEELEKVSFTVNGKGDILYYGENPELYSNCMTISGRDPGKALEVLGFEKESKKIFGKFKSAVTDSKCKTLIVEEPSAYDFLKDKFNNVKVIHCSEYLLSGKVNTGSARKAYYLDSDFLKNYDGNISAPLELLKKCGYEIVPFGTNSEESYSIGEGAIIYDDLNPDLCEKLCRRVYGLADNLVKDLFITASRYVKNTLKKYNSQIKIISIEEAVAQKKENK